MCFTKQNKIHLKILYFRSSPPVLPYRHWWRKEWYKDPSLATCSSSCALSLSSMNWRRSWRRIGTWPLLFIICIENAFNRLKNELEKDQYLAPCYSSSELSLQSTDWRRSWRRIGTWPPALHHMHWVCI